MLFGSLLVHVNLFGKHDVTLFSKSQSIKLYWLIILLRMNFELQTSKKYSTRLRKVQYKGDNRSLALHIFSNHEPIH